MRVRVEIGRATLGEGFAEVAGAGVCGEDGASFDECGAGGHVVCFVVGEGAVAGHLPAFLFGEASEVEAGLCFDVVVLDEFGNGFHGVSFG